MRRWFSGLRQTIETTIDKMLQWFRLLPLLPHTLRGFHVKVAAKSLAHNLYIGSISNSGDHL